MIQSKNLKQSERISHGFFTRQGGVSKNIYASLNCGFGAKDDSYQNVVKNRAIVAAKLGVAAENLVTAKQCHSTDVLYVPEPFAHDARPDIDALITGKPGLAIGVLTADCAPVLFADNQANIIAAAHAGWRGALGGILEATLEKMESHGATRENIAAAIGPAISQDAYEVGREFMDEFLDADETSKVFFSQDKTRPRFNLTAYVHNRLEKSGLTSIENLSLCTYADESRFYSYRRSTHKSEPGYGCQISAIAITI